MRKKYYTFLPWTLPLIPSFDSELDKLLRVLHPIWNFPNQIWVKRNDYLIKEQIFGSEVVQLKHF